MAEQGNKELGGRLESESVWLLAAAERLEVQHLKERLQDLLTKERKMREAKAPEQKLAEVRAQIAGTERELKQIHTHYAERGELLPEFRAQAEKLEVAGRRIHQLRVAAQNLKMAEEHDIAHKLMEKAEAMERDVQEAKQRLAAEMHGAHERHGEHGPDVVRELKEEIKRLRAKVKELPSEAADRHTERRPKEETVVAAIGAGEVQSAPENCPACAMGLTAEFVFKRLDVDEDKLVTVTEFMRSPGMQDMAKAHEIIGRLDKNGDGKLSWEELETAYKARHANCKKSDPATLAANVEKVGPDGRGDGNRFSQVFILRSDQNGDGKISRQEFRGPAIGFDRLDKNKNGFIEADELGDLHQRRLEDPKSMRERLESGDIPTPQAKRPSGLGDADAKKE